MPGTPQFVTGLARVPNGIRGLDPSVRFEQYERHTAWDRPGGVTNRVVAGSRDIHDYQQTAVARIERVAQAQPEAGRQAEARDQAEIEM